MRRDEQHETPSAPHLVAHRGYPSMVPGNTVIGFQAALQAGARFLELDIQLTADGVPVLYHDRDTRRMSGVEGPLWARTHAELQHLEASFPARFGDRFRGNPIPSLADFCRLLSGAPQVTVFVELKRASLKQFGRQTMVDTVIETLTEIYDQTVLISFDDHAVEYARAAHGARIGWVLPAWSEQTQRRADKLACDYLFCSTERLPEDDHRIWQGAWQWTVYVVDEPEWALGLYRRGIDLVETDRIVDMLQHPLLGARAAYG